MSRSKHSTNKFNSTKSFKKNKNETKTDKRESKKVNWMLRNYGEHEW